MNDRSQCGIVSHGAVNVEPLWFDSLGAKSSSVLVTTPDVALLVDPGAAVMHPSYPLSCDAKEELRESALRAIAAAAGRADMVFVSHYHYDHYLMPHELPGLYAGKQLWLKDPNRFVCRSQWRRARDFLCELCAVSDVEELQEEPAPCRVGDPLEELPLAAGRDFGDYASRRMELLRRGRERLGGLAEFWASSPPVSETMVARNRVFFADGREIAVGATRIRFSTPMFHGVEYTSLGWVVGLVVEHGGTRFLYSSDLQGPVIEDYADWIIREEPSILVVDGPPTYLLGFLMSRVNLDRCVENMCEIVRRCSARTIIYDHHLLRGRRFRERTERVWNVARQEGRGLLTVAELFGEEPLVLRS